MTAVFLQRHLNGQKSLLVGLLGLCCCGWLHGCPTDLSRYSRSQPEKSQLVGTWLLTTEDPSESKSKRVSSLKLILRSDGTYLLTVTRPAQPKPTYILRTLKDSGQWDIDNTNCDGNDCWWEISFRAKQGGDIGANLCGEEPYAIEFSGNDYVDGEFIYLEKSTLP